MSEHTLEAQLGQSTGNCFQNVGNGRPAGGQQQDRSHPDRQWDFSAFLPDVRLHVGGCIVPRRLKNIISSSSSVPDCSSEGGSSFTNMEICSISSQRLRMHAKQTNKPTRKTPQDQLME
ncbi:serine-rich and transmembrane domain-containing protein 1 isoform X2 [Xiphophorus hellerii]|uniref:serine-rich and transmembrane domain-containing protein 1 isoform X2 n=1 Tax=Xiphophorus hellerii TaxID=8084 RepID=UPI0013B45B70|nr:serine-rich and transmembrane domain-containing protein 1 isoform X2 [Xiphophorus hellerii]